MSCWITWPLGKLNHNTLQKVDITLYDVSLWNTIYLYTNVSVLLAIYL